jgi:hypothetical protein
MSKIAIAAKHPTRSLPLAKTIHEVTGLALSSTINRLASGQLGIFYATELFRNDHLEKEEKILCLLDAMAANSVEPLILEVSCDVAWADLAAQDLAKYEIAPLVLRRILEEASGRFR